MTHQRIEYMDALRVISALSVVLIHAVNPVSFSYVHIPISTWWLSNILNIIGRASVPLFVMLSGALLLSPSRKHELPSVMFKKRLLRIVGLYAIWSVIYFIWRAVGLHQNLSYQIIIDSLLAGTPGEQLYFLPLIAGLYIVTPLLRAAIWSLPLKHVTYYTIMLLILAAGWQYIGSLPGHAPSYNIINQFVPFVGYYLLGFVLTQLKSQPARWIPWTLYTAGILIPSVATYLFVSRIIPVTTPYYMYDFLNPFIVMQATGAWLIVREYYPRLSTRWPRLQRWMHMLSSATLSLYLIHLLVLQYFAQYIDGFPAAARPLTYLWMQVGVAGTTALLLALITVRLPIVRRLVT